MDPLSRYLFVIRHWVRNDDDYNLNLPCTWLVVGYKRTKTENEDIQRILCTNALGYQCPTSTSIHQDLNNSYGVSKCRMNEWTVIEKGVPLIRRLIEERLK